MESRHSLPNLRALGVFEVAATHESFTMAGAELGVSQAAVSKTIKLLERELGCELFLRRGRAIELTDNGRALLGRCRSAFDHLREGCELLADEGARVSVSIAANTAVSHYWLAPLLTTFSDSEPTVSVRLMTSDDDRDLTSGASDLAILYGYGQRLGWTQTHLFDEQLVPVASRAWIEEHNLADQLPLDPPSIAGLAILDHELAGPGWTNFGSWLREVGLPDQQPRHRIFSRYTLAVEAMLAGEGVALGSIPLLPERLHGHEVVPLSDVCVRPGRSYYLASRAGAPLTAQAQQLMNWLVDQGGHS